ncbi:MAG: TetR family transcriptional regulator [Myxococcota bacterium]|nr:TetR family transcriptional regulator [Myxococcota bacterium]
MYSVSSTPQTRGRAREAILWATLNLVAESGVDAVTHRRVAQRAGVSLGSTTHHFSGRQDLLRESFRHYLIFGNRMISALAETVGQRSPHAIDRVREILVALVEREFTDPQLVRAEYELLLYATRDPELSQMVTAWEANLVGTLAAALRKTGASRPTEFAHTLVNFVRGFEMERLVQPELGIDELRGRLTPLLGALCQSPPLNPQPNV